MRYLPLADLDVLSVSRNTFAQEHQKKNYAGVVALMADISKTAGKVVYMSTILPPRGPLE